LEIDYDPENGWHKPVISPYHKFLIDPRNSSLHYAIQLFEGMKAFRSVKKEGQIMLFRPDMNMKRMRISAKRIGLPVRFQNLINIFRIFQGKN
jgi:branched-chain amino acid aminotransferase